MLDANRGPELFSITRIDETQLSGQLVGVLLEYEVDAFANVDSDRHLCPIVENVQRLILFRRDVHRCGDLLARHLDFSGRGSLAASE